MKAVGLVSVWILRLTVTVTAISKECQFQKPRSKDQKKRLEDSLIIIRDGH